MFSALYACTLIPQHRCSQMTLCVRMCEEMHTHTHQFIFILYRCIHSYVHTDTQHMHSIFVKTFEFVHNSYVHTYAHNSILQTLCCVCNTYAFSFPPVCSAAPEITQRPSDHDAYPNEMFSLSCTASGTTFQGWVFENGAEMMKITTSDDYDITNTETSGSLTIKAFKKELAGRYRCLFTTEGVGSILSQPATVRQFGELYVPTPTPVSAMLGCSYLRTAYTHAYIHVQ